MLCAILIESFLRCIKTNKKRFLFEEDKHNFAQLATMLERATQQAKTATASTIPIKNVE